LKLRVDVDGEAFLLEMMPNGTYSLRGETEQNGSAQIEEVMPGVFSVLLGTRSLQVHVAPREIGFEVSTGLERHLISLSDPRDRASDLRKGGAAGPVEVRAQMPGKIIKLLAAEGSAVSAGQGLIVVEAMKMQNEVKSPKDGTLTQIHVAEGATVSAGDRLLVVE
jgi:biotin carboxyl carrier protein